MTIPHPTLPIELVIEPAAVQFTLCSTAPSKEARLTDPAVWKWASAAIERFLIDHAAPDPFEDWWHTLAPYNDADEHNSESRWILHATVGSRPVTKVDARAIWDAAIASKGVQP